MRIGVLALLVSTALSLPAQQQPAPATTPEAAPNLTIPARLSKTLASDKARKGDPVEFKTIEAVLVGKGLVMPPDSRLHGRVLGAASRQGDKPSWLVVLVERADWKQHTLPLHAFITAQITEIPKPLPDAASPPDTAPPESNPRRAGRQAYARARAGADFSTLAPAPQDSTAVKDERIVNYRPLDDVHILRDKGGITFLVSNKPHLKIPGGVLLMLQNQPLTAAAPTTDSASAPAGSSATALPQPH